MKGKIIGSIGSGILATAFILFSACSHVEAPNQSGVDDDELSFDQKSERQPVQKGEETSASKKNNSSNAILDDDLDNYENFDDFDDDDFSMSFDFDGNSGDFSMSSGGMSISSILDMSGNSSEQKKYDCDFSENDEIWNLDISEGANTGNAIITFDKRSTKIKIDAVSQDSTAENCQQSAALLTLLLSDLGNGDGFTFSCNGTSMTTKGTMTDTTKTVADKSALYKDLCK